MERTLGRASAVAFAFFFLTFHAHQSQGESLGNEFIPPGHWTYPALKRFEALGLVELPSEEPYTRPDVIAYVEAIVSTVRTKQALLSPRDRYQLERLEKEYSSTAAQVDPTSRFDPPVLYATDDPLQVEGDLALSFIPSRAPLDAQWAFFLMGDPSLRLHFRNWLTWDARYLVTLGPERDNRVAGAKPSRRTKSWRGVTSLYERGYLAFEWQRRVTLYWGRDYANWGPSENGNLILSETAGSLDKFGARIRFKNLVFSFLDATLSAAEDRRLAAHRLEVRLWGSVVGLSEAVVYAERGFDPMYMLPLSSFYANSYNEQGEDNLLWALDVKSTIADGLVLSGNFLVDDYQFEPNQPYPNKLAFDVGGRIALDSPLATTVRFQYRYVDIYTYTHEDTATYWFTGEAEPALDSPLGAPQGPDSDTAFLDVAVYPMPSLTTAVSFSLRRRGEGNDYRMFQLGDDINPSFPSGVVENTIGLGLGVEWELPRNSSVGGSVVRARVTNVDHQPDNDEWTTSVFVHLTWNL